jgi:hypothetical protein
MSCEQNFCRALLKVAGGPHRYITVRTKRKSVDLTSGIRSFRRNHIDRFNAHRMGSRLMSPTIGIRKELTMIRLK